MTPQPRLIDQAIHYLGLRLPEEKYIFLVVSINHVLGLRAQPEVLSKNGYLQQKAPN